MSLTDKSADVWRYDVDDFEFAASCHTGRDEQIVASFIIGLRRAIESGPRHTPLRWLDVGSGPGSLVLRLLRATQRTLSVSSLSCKTASCIFVDSDLATCRRLECVLKRIPDAYARQCHVKHCDAVTYASELAQKRTTCFDIISAIHVFYYLPDWLSLVCQLRELTPRGIVFLALKSRETNFYAFMRELYDSYGCDVPKPFFAEDMKALLYQEGIPFLCREAESRISVPNADDEVFRLLRFVLRLGPTHQDDRVDICRRFRERFGGSRELDFRDFHFILNGV